MVSLSTSYQPPQRCPVSCPTASAGALALVSPTTTTRSYRVSPVRSSWHASISCPSPSLCPLLQPLACRQHPRKYTRTPCVCAMASSRSNTRGFTKSAPSVSIPSRWITRRCSCASTSFARSALPSGRARKWMLPALCAVMRLTHPSITLVPLVTISLPAATLPKTKKTPKNTEETSSLFLLKMDTIKIGNTPRIKMI